MFIWIAQAITLVAHVVDAKHPFMFNWMDWILYALCIGSEFWAIKKMKQKIISEESSVKLLQQFKLLLVCDSALFIVDIFFDYVLWSATTFLVLIALKQIILACILFFLLKCMDFHLNKGIDGIKYPVYKWYIICIYLLRGFIIYGASCEETFFSYDLWAIGLIFIWTMYSLFIVEDSLYQYKLYRTDLKQGKYVEEKNDSIALSTTPKSALTIISLVLICAYAMVILVCGICSKIYKDGPYYLTDESRNKVSQQSSVDEFELLNGDMFSNTSDYVYKGNSKYYRFKEENIMPKWTHLHKSRYGIIRGDGKIEGKYPIPLNFDFDRIAPDGKGHIIDISGKIVVDLPYMYKAAPSHRTILSRLAISDFFSAEHYYSYSSYDSDSVLKTKLKLNEYCFEKISRYKYDSVSNYMTKSGNIWFKSEINAQEALYNKDGHYILEPKYDTIDIYYDEDIIYAVQKDKGYLYNGKGELISKQNIINDHSFFISSVCSSPKLIWYECFGEDSKYVIIDFKGNIIQEDISKIINSEHTKYSKYIEFSIGNRTYYVGADHVVNEGEPPEE